MLDFVHRILPQTIEFITTGSPVSLTETSRSRTNIDKVEFKNRISKSSISPDEAAALKTYVMGSGKRLQGHKVAWYTWCVVTKDGQRFNLRGNIVHSRLRRDGILLDHDRGAWYGAVRKFVVLTKPNGQKQQLVVFESYDPDAYKPAIASDVLTTKRLISLGNVMPKLDLHEAHYILSKARLFTRFEKKTGKLERGEQGKQGPAVVLRSVFQAPFVFN